MRYLLWESILVPTVCAAWPVQTLTCEMAMLIGRGAAAVLTSSTGHKPRILIGKDTRQSGDIRKLP